MLFADKLQKIEGYGKKKKTQKILKLLSDRDETVRAACAIAMGKIGDIDCINNLISCVSDSSPSVRIAAINSLAALGANSAKAHLDHQLSIEKDEAVREAIKTALHSIKNVE